MIIHVLVFFVCVFCDSFLCSSSLLLLSGSLSYIIRECGSTLYEGLGHAAHPLHT